MKLVAEVLTSCEEDKFRRVKVKCPSVWEESNLIPSVNTIPLYPGDRVLVDITMGPDNAYIVGQILDAKVVKVKENKGVQLYKTKDNSSWAAAWGTAESLLWENSEGVKVHISGKSITIESGEIKINADSLSVDAQTEITHKATPSSENPGVFCALPNCMFTGTPHSSSKTS